jgi:hypothetical protein
MSDEKLNAFPADMSAEPMRVRSTGKKAPPIHGQRSCGGAF